MVTGDVSDAALKQNAQVQNGNSRDFAGTEKKISLDNPEL